MNSGNIIGNIAFIDGACRRRLVVVSLARAVRIVPQSQAYVVERLGGSRRSCRVVSTCWSFVDSVAAQYRSA